MEKCKCCYSDIGCLKDVPQGDGKLVTVSHPNPLTRGVVGAKVFVRVPIKDDGFDPIRYELGRNF